MKQHDTASDEKTRGSSLTTLDFIYVRTNNIGQPNSSNDIWEKKLLKDATLEELAELDGSKYFGKGWKRHD